MIYTIGPYLLPDLVRQVIARTPQMPLRMTMKNSVMRATLSRPPMNSSRACSRASGTASSPSQTWARSHDWAEPSRHDRTRLRGQSSSSKTMIRPATTPAARPVRLLPPGRRPAAAHSRP
ncbi:MAG: hypothetical protein EBX36_10405 [Planctomycetia bacterium]|nr:hypothetical protein [Planctomycetia bacterium]